MVAAYKEDIDSDDEYANQASSIPSPTPAEIASGRDTRSYSSRAADEMSVATPTPVGMWFIFP